MSFCCRKCWHRLWTYHCLYLSWENSLDETNPQLLLNTTTTDTDQHSSHWTPPLWMFLIKSSLNWRRFLVCCIDGNGVYYWSKLLHMFFSFYIFCKTQHDIIPLSFPLNSLSRNICTTSWMYTQNLLSDLAWTWI